MERRGNIFEGDVIRRDAWLFHRKALQRYGVILDREDISSLRSQIESGRIKIINSALIPDCYVYQVTLFKDNKPVSMRVIYNPSKKEFVTAIPTNGRSLQARLNDEHRTNHRGAFLAEKPRKHLHYKRRKQY